MKVIFAGTPEFAAAALAALHQAGFELPLVLTQPDRPAGRGMQLQASPVKQFALNHGIPVAQPVSLKTDGKHAEVAAQAQALLRTTPHDVMVVAAYGLILPASVLQIPRLGCINIHASLLPRWRGAAPIHRAIEAGDTDTGITLMQMDEGLDTGAMIATGSEAILPDDTTATLHDRLAALGARMIVDALTQLAQGMVLTVTPQPDAGVTYAAKISKQDAVLDFRQPAVVLERRIRAFHPFPGAVAQIGELALKVTAAGLSSAHGQPGEVLRADASGVTVACGEGALTLTELQKPGGKRLAAATFLQGFPITTGQRFRVPD
jgi:methionyl-tRNA formyltransferase